MYERHRNNFLKTDSQLEGFSKVIFLIVFCLIIITLSSIYILNSLKNASRLPIKIVTPKIDEATLSKDSVMITGKDTLLYSLQSYDGYFYKARGKGADAAREFISNNPVYNSTGLIPKSFAGQPATERGYKDSKDVFFKKNNIAGSSEHYFFDQKIQNIPVFGAQLAIHLRNGNEIYSVTGNLVKNDTIGIRKLTDLQAKKIALEQAQTEEKYAPLKAEEGRQFIINKKILYEGDDETNYLTLGVTVTNADATADFGKQYFIDLSSGNIVFVNQKVLNALNRSIQDARDGQVRSEGQPVLGGDGYADKVYDMIGKYYNYFSANFGRDGLDGKGGQIHANIKLPCRNATWNGTSVNVCTDYAVEDVVFHELTHGFTDYANSLIASGESLVLHEGNADIFSYFLINKWMQGGAPTTLPVIRNAQNPASINQPEKLFSGNWLCGGDAHKKAVVMGHAVYLMSAGGTENGCTIAPIGTGNAAKIEYQAWTKYITSTANLLDYYTAMMNACNDLFGQSSATCASVRSALQATELDQQTAGTGDSPKCSGIAEKIPACAVPAVTEAPTSASAQPTSAPAQPTPTPVRAGVNPAGNVVAPPFVCLGGVPCHTPAPTDTPVIEPSQVQWSNAAVPEASISPASIIPENNSVNQNTDVAVTNENGSAQPAKTGQSGGLMSLILEFLQELLKIFRQLFGGNKANAY